MKKVRIINNPSSGRNIVQKRLDSIANILLDKGYIVGKYCTEKKYDAMHETIRTCEGDWDMIIACGGDGTVNEVASGIAKSDRKLPVAILPAGTVNDFANYLNIPNAPESFCEMIEKENIISVDLGKMNDKYFVNVAAGGVLTSVAHTVPPESKSIFGRAAYYVEGMKEMPRQVKNVSRVRIESEEYTSEEEVSLFLITNSSSIGGFKKLAPYADIEDGFLDCVIIGKTEVQDLITLFIELIKGEHIDNPKVRYFKTKCLSISSLEDEEVVIDIDGEFGGKLPIKIEVEPRVFKVFIP